MMHANNPLAAQLNDLGAANADGLLNDDEYRLLRQNLFERYSGGVEIFSVDPPSPPAVKLPSAPPRRKHVELVPDPVPPPARPKTNGVAGFLRRATGRKPAPAAIKLSFLPRMFSKKSEDTSSSDTESYGTRHSSSTSRKPSGDLSSTRIRPPPMSPTHGNFAAAPASPSRSVFSTAKYDVIPGGSTVIFDDSNLQTSDAIRKAMQAVEAEGRRLVAAFNDLEASAVTRYRQEHPEWSSNRRPSLTPVAPSGGSLRPGRMRSNSNSQQSVRSNSPLRTSRSAASLFPTSSPPTSFSQPAAPPPTAPRSSLLPRLPESLRRKGSASSLSSQGTSAFLGTGTGIGRANSLSRASSVSRSATHLPLPVSRRDGTGGTTSIPEGEGGEELAEVRRRRAEVVGRCEARLEYLRAKLKGAELHEKLMRK
ncbi:hypothetical protein FB45DRAFT_887152 [Roridomyces roridus]|uniref:Uncharacterized protein n=1 Tax=Roridomyces roridus TaxID=1738132 RepID=A0AAD7FYB9_9AGAR|nr:hypothetical protein FB45DRAFT_887152 [Roridomyces roridus]